jgi:ABC-type transport system involved in cytochrome bd biosynthesis fused ATPase/permease subunit
VHGVHAARTTGAAGTSFTAEPGEIVAIVGPTGAGKTSLLRALLGLDPSSGSVRYGAEELCEAGVGPSQRPFAWVPQEPAIVSGSIEENVALAAPEGAGAEAARDALEAIGASELLTRRAGATLDAGGPELSGGERQWIAIARAIGSGLPVLLLDEPTSGLDGEAQERVLHALRSLRGRRTILIVTHRTEPLAIADRIVELSAAPAPAAAAE